MEISGFRKCQGDPQPELLQRINDNVRKIEIERIECKKSQINKIKSRKKPVNSFISQIKTHNWDQIIQKAATFEPLVSLNLAKSKFSL